MTDILKVLLVEDDESDAGLILRCLEKAGYAPESERVETGAELQFALTSRAWDIVLSDYRLPQFDALAALALLKASGIDIPFVVISGQLGEETAVALMQAGAQDTLRKDNLARLAPVVARELAEALQRQAFRLAGQQLREGEARYRSLFENSPIAQWEEDFSEVKKRIDALRAGGLTDFRAYLASQAGLVLEFARIVKILDVNQAALDFQKLTSKQEFLGGLGPFIPEGATQEFLPELIMIFEGRVHFEYEGINQDGVDFHMHWAAISGHEHDLSRVIVSIQDISQRKQAERQLRQAETRLRSLVEKMPAIVYTELADEPGRIVYISPQIEAMTGYAPQEWIGSLSFWKKIVHPDDLEMVEQEDMRCVRSGQPFKVDYRIRRRDGQPIWMRDEAVLIHDEDGKALFWQGVKHDINEEKRAEAELKSSQAQLAQLLGNLPGMAMRSRLDPDWGMEFASEGSLALTGYLPEELTANSGQLFGSLIHPQDREMVRQTILNSTRAGTPFQITYRLLPSVGPEKWVWEKGQAILTGSQQPQTIEAFLIDITESKLVEAAVQRHLAELEVLFETSLRINRLLDPRKIADGVIEILETNLNWRHISIRLYNAQTGRVDLLAMNQSSSRPHGELEAQELALSQSITGRNAGLSGWVYQHGEAVLCPRVKDDSRYVETHPEVRSGLYVPLRSGERIIGSISVESDLELAFNEQDERMLSTMANQIAISIENAQLYLLAQVELAARAQAEAELLQAQTRLEQRVAERTADLKEANLRLEKAARLKDEFLASMSHELRTPLTGILGLSDVLQLQTYGPLSDKQLTALKHIAVSGRHLLDMINDILDFSRIEARLLILRLVPCQVAPICQSGLKMVADQAAKRKVETNFSIDKPDLVIQADPQRLKQMIANLLSNAIKFTPVGGRLGIEVKCGQQDGLAHITVWDTGIGIKKEDMPRLFQTFVQLDSSLARQYNGTGLGLALVLRLAELHGGSISVESRFGEGSRFTLSLPWEGR